MIRQTSILAIAMTVALSLAGCAGEDGTEDDRPDTTVSSRAGAAPTGGAQVADPAQSLATGTFDSPVGKVQFTVNSLTVRDRIAELVLTITPSSAEDTSPIRINGNDIPDVSLIDTANLKRHVVVEDAKGSKLGTPYTSLLKAGQPNTVQYTFAAPPENVQTLDVAWGRYPSFRDVPVSR